MAETNKFAWIRSMTVCSPSQPSYWHCTEHGPIALCHGQVVYLPCAFHISTHLSTLSHESCNWATSLCFVMPFCQPHEGRKDQPKPWKLLEQHQISFYPQSFHWLHDPCHSGGKARRKHRQPSGNPQITKGKIDESGACHENFDASQLRAASTLPWHALWTRDQSMTWLQSRHSP